MRNARLLQHITHQFQPYQRIVQLHQLLLEIKRNGQQLAPAIRHPPTIVQLSSGWSDGVEEVRVALLKCMQDLCKRVGGLPEVFGYRYYEVLVNVTDIRNPD